MATTAESLFARVMLSLDDEAAIRTTTPDLFLRHVNRAQQWVALRYQLLRQTFPVSLFASTPLYALTTTHPRLVVVTHMALSDGTPLWPVPLTSLRYKDTAWFATTGATPALFYRIGWRYVGVVPVPTLNTEATLTGLLCPRELTEMASPVQIPESYLPQLVHVATGLFMLSRERRYALGLAHITQGLGLQMPSQAAVPVERGAVDVAG